MTPTLISRLVIELRMAVDVSLVQVWDGDHFTAAESGVHEMVDFARPPLPPIQFAPFPIETSSSRLS